MGTLIVVLLEQGDPEVLHERDFQPVSAAIPYSNAM
jgi:hypothetical protein